MNENTEAEKLRMPQVYKISYETIYFQIHPNQKPLLQKTS